MKHDILPPAKDAKAARNHMAATVIPVKTAAAGAEQAVRPIRRRKRNYARLISNDDFIFNV